MVSIALKLKNDIHYVLQNFGACNGALFGYMTNDNNRYTARFSHFEQCCGALPDLRDATCRRLDKVGVYGLDRVYYHHFGLDSFDLCGDILEQCFGINQALLVANSKPVGSHFDLLARLLARDI